MADTQLIKDRIDIVQLIQEYLPLKKAGANWKAPCPFHHEKSPSFMVHPERQIWHCFGCGKGGDIFSFIQEIEGLDFVEALKLLAGRAGVAIDTFKNETNASERSRLLQINDTAATFFHRFLLEMPGAQSARDYLEQRKLSLATIGDWQIGFIPDQWSLLTQYLLKKGYGIEDLVKSGLTIKRDQADVKSGRGFYDRFRGRIMFPIADAHGNIVGFTGRVLVATADSGGKYVNTPQTLLYDKSRVLYGLPKAKIEMKNKDLAVLVEGQVDVIACHQAGMKNVVAVSGTALTSDQVKLIKRYTNNLAFAFDADAAGENAGKRGITTALAEGMQIRVIQIPKDIAKDADECLKKDPAIWFSAVNNARGIMEWYLERTLAQFDVKNPRAKQQAAEILLAEVRHIPYAVERDDWLKKISSALGVEPEILREELSKIKRSEPRPRSAVSTAPGSQPAAKPKTLLSPEDESAERLNTELWSLCLKFPQIFASLAGSFKEEYVIGTSFVALYETVKNLYTNLGMLKLEELRQFFAIPDQENYIDVLELRPYRNFGELTPEIALAEARQIIGRLQELWRKKRGGEIQRAIALAQERGETEREKALLQELQLL